MGQSPEILPCAATTTLLHLNLGSQGEAQPEPWPLTDVQGQGGPSAGLDKAMSVNHGASPKVFPERGDGTWLCNAWRLSGGAARSLALPGGPERDRAASRRPASVVERLGGLDQGCASLDYVADFLGSGAAGPDFFPP
jgi:hypothetical protein